MSAVPDSDRAAVVDALRSLDAADGIDTMTLLRLSRLNSGQARPVLEQLVSDGAIEVWWTDANPSVRMHRAKEQA